MKTVSGRLTLAVVIFSLLALAASQVIVWGFVAPAMERERVANFSNAAELMALHLEDWWRTRMNFLRGTSYGPAILDFLSSPQNQRTNEISEFLKSVSKEWGYNSMLLFSPKGEIILSSPNEFPKDFLPELDFENLYEATVPFRVGSPDNELLLLIKRVVREGKNMGFVGVLIDWDAEVEPLLAFPVPGTQTGECFLSILRDGKILPISDLRFLPGAEFTSFLPEPEGPTIPARKALLGQSGTERAFDYRGASVLASYHFIPGPNWGLVVKEDWVEVMWSAGRASRIGFLAALILVGLLALFFYFLFKGITKPLKSLELQADEIAAGADLKIELGKAPMEIKKLGENLSLMVQRIKEKDQEILRYERDWSRSLTETAKVLIISLDLKGNITFFNREAEEKLGFKKEEVLGKPVDFLFPEERRDGVRKFISNIELSIIPQNQVLPLISRDGKRLTIDWAITIIKDPGGNPQNIVGIGTDISEKEKILEEKELQVKRLDLLNRINQEIIFSDLEDLTPMARSIREVLDAHTVLILKTDRERKTITPIGWNWRPGYYEIPDEVLVQRLPTSTDKGLVGYCIREGKPVFSGDAERDPRAHHIEGTTYSDESVMVIPLRFKEIILGAIFAGKMGLNQFGKEDQELLETIAGSLAVALHNKELLRELKEEEERFRGLFTSIPDFILLHDSEGKILEANDPLLQTLGYSREELIGQNVSILDAPESKQIGQQFLEEILRNGSGRIELINLSKNGEPIPMDIFARRIQYKGKTAILGVSRDVRERKKLEQVKNDLLYAISHEMKTPIQSLLALEDIYSSLNPETLTKRAGELFEVMKRNTFRLKQLVDNFLEAQKLEQESLELNPIPIEPSIIIKETQDMILPYAALKKITFKNDLPQEEIILQADKERLVEVFTNLYSNALRFSPKEGVVTTSLQKKGDSLEISISDQGPGIPEEEIKNLFERFFRPQSPNLRAMAGTGLGLYISRRIVESHGGKIWVESQEGRGTTIKFTLPLKRENSGT